MRDLYTHVRQSWGHRSTEWLLLGLIIALGYVLRLRFYFSDRSLWVDELFLAQLLREKSWQDSFSQMGLGQVITPGYFLFLELFNELFGAADWALRLSSLLPGLLLLPLLYFVFKPLCKRSTMIFLMLTASCNMWLIYYSAEVKPYTLDILFAVILFWLMRLLMENPRWWLWTAWGAVCLLGVFLSLTTYLMGAITGLVLIGAFLRSDPRRCLMLVYVSLPGMAFGVLQWWFSLRGHHSSDPIDNYWYGYGGFMPTGELGQALQWLIITPFSWMTQPLGTTNIWGSHTVASGLLLTVCVYGFVRLYHHQRVLFVYAALSFALFIILGALAVYPARGRVILCLYPVLLLVFAFALNDIFTAIRYALKRVSKKCYPWGYGGALCLLALLLAVIFQPMFRTAVLRYYEPPSIEPTEAVIRDLLEAKSPGDHVYVYFWSTFGINHYGPRMDFDPNQLELVTMGYHMEEEHHKYGEDIIARYAGEPRVWLVLIHTRTYWPLDHHDVIVDQLKAAGGVSIYQRYYSEAALLLYNLEHVKQPEVAEAQQKEN